MILLHDQIAQLRQRRRRSLVGRTEVFCDFDGTITVVDATDAVLETFALPAWREWEERWVNGEITSQECLSRQVELIRADRNTVAAFAADLPIDDGIFLLDRKCAEFDIPLTIVSDGLDVVVEAVLRRHGLLHIPTFSNHVRWEADGHPSLSFPFAAPDCDGGAGTCKCAITAPCDRHSSSRTVYIGDGRSDRCVSAKVDILFAKESLRDWCADQDITHHPFESLADVAERIGSKGVSTP